MLRDREHGAQDVEWGAEQGSLLLGLVVAIFLILLVLGIAAPKVAQALKREREVEAVHRGNQYVRAIRLYYKKTGTYPGSLEQLEKTNNIRYLRQRYADPMTGKADWRLIKVGEAKTTVKGFFGKPLTGLTPGLGSAAGMASSGTGGAGSAGGNSGSAFGSPGSSSGSAFGGASSGSSAFGSSSPGTSGAGGLGSSSGSAFGGSSGSAFGSSSSGGSSSPDFGSSGSPGAGTPGVGGSSGTGDSGTAATGSGSNPTGNGFPTGGTPFVGVGLPTPGDSILVLNEQTTYQTWEFLYDPRIEQLLAQASLFGGAPSAGSAGSLGSAAGSSSSFGGTTPGASGSGFGSSSGPGFGSSPANGTGSSGTGSTGTNTTGVPVQQ
jgi:type II secretory pathway pseudopilin PulG